MRTQSQHDDPFVLEELNDAAAAGSAIAAIISIGSVFFVLTTLYGRSEFLPTVFWSSSICSIALAMFISSTYRHRGRRSLFNMRLHSALAFAIGVCWGGCLFVLAPAESIYTISVLTVIVSGVIIASMLVQLTNPTAWILMFVPAVGLHSIYLYTSSEPGHFQLATVNLIYCTLMAAVTTSIKNFLVENIRAQYQLQEQNEEILDKNTRLYKLAHYDGLTGAANRKLLIGEANDRIESLKATSKTCAFILIDLDHFKHLNDTMGHAAGDELLRIVAGRLRHCVRKNDIIARLGGDEFGVFIADISDRDVVHEIAQKILRSLDQPQRIHDTMINCRASAGVALFPEHGITTSELMNNADLALQSVKKKGRGKYEVCTDELKKDAIRKMTVEAELRQALRRRNVGFHFQPIIDTDTGKITGAEALLRIIGGQETKHSAEDFIQVSAAVGLSEELSLALFDSLEDQAQALFETLPDLQKVSINLSPLELRSSLPVRRISEMFARGFLSPEQLQIEITEQSILERGSDQARKSINQLAEMGVPIVMDDFGTGYSSLTHLKSLPISGIKIDKSFVNELNNDLRDAAIVRSLVGMCKGLGLTVTAEGVEHFAQFEALRRLGCDYVQGYLFFKADSVEALRHIMSNNPPSVMTWMRTVLRQQPEVVEPQETRQSI